ncbi:UvrD-helicase domain-containing protein [Nocardia australiensis]|uniref:UvrD-helicase domain-containing protein n=1 Tax=Nocardia australiensis TaxID=2887191 RepID=UPI001D13B5A6|nr:UvrD-helicase domain-containing protein [Nocardia australiensis]
MTTLYRADAFTRDRIQACASELGMQLSDQEQWDFLQSVDTLDLQAAPGSGKTSLIGLKLQVLAEHWMSTTRGVCVLSHTNTAKDEIIARISDSPSGARLQRYPHFIGTIQSFTSTFLASPHLRGMRTQVQIVDNDAYADEARRTLASGQSFRTLKSLLGRQRNGDDLVAHAEFSFESGQLTIRSSRELPFGPDTNSGKQFTTLKYELARQGIFRYADMFALAELHLSRRPTLGRAVAHRFPFVLVDEMQDTSALQQKLLDQVFGDPSTIVQRVGDVNQRIFTDSTTTTSSFPRSDSLDLPVSRRFGSTIAELASSLTVHRSQRIRGAGPAGTIAVLLYDETSVPQVVPAFERIAAEVVPHSLLRDRPPRVLASRLRPGTSKAFPQSLACYVPGFAATIPGDRQASLLITARAARAQWRSGASRTAVDLLWEAVRAATKSATNEALPTLRSLSRDAETLGARMRALLLDILTDPNDDETSWEGLMDRMASLLSELSSQAGPVRITLGEFAHYVAPSTSSSAAVVDERDGAPVGTVHSELGSIQSAKGETHTATLILECLNRSGKNHDVHEVLKLLATNGDLDSATSTVRDIAQLVFVGATRPTQLLAFAVRRDRASSYLNFLAFNGWAVHDLTLQSDTWSRICG